MKLIRVVGGVGVGLVVLAALSAPAGAQDWRAGTGRLEGKVADAQGRPVASAVVKLELPGRGGTDHPPAVLDALDKAESAYREGRYAEARREYEALLALRPDLAARIHQQIGFSYVREKDHARALDHLQLTLDAEPGNVPVRAAAVQAAFEAGRPERGRELLAGLAVETVSDPDIAFNFGIDLLNAGATREAIPWFTRSIDLDARSVDGYYRRALAHLQLGEVAECRADFEKVVELAPGTPQGDLARKALEQVR